MNTSEYDSLSNSIKRKRIGRLASQAAGLYPIDAAITRLHCFATNPLYTVRCADGTRYILRMAYPGWRTLEDLYAEAAWLEALDRDTDIGAPRIIRAKNGETVLPMKNPEVPYTWNATLMTWVDGRLLAHYLTSPNLEKFGELFARLHIHGKTWTPPEGFTRRRFEHYISRDEPNVLFSDEVLNSFCELDRKSLIWAGNKVESEYAGLDSSDLRVIHCDLWHENVKLHYGLLHPFDFEDTVWGYRLHDISMGMLDLLETVGNERYSELLAAFRQGYIKHLEWPAGSLETLQIGRMLWLANWRARFRRESLTGKVREYGLIFRKFEATGTLHIPDSV
jgi:Ser/Thr protein kinase RdoA (MazF antagonist)